MDSDSRITSVEDVPADTTFLFTVRDVDTDEDFEFVDVGPIETDDADLSSTSNVEF